MNTTSSLLSHRTAGLAALALAACIQGPWDYYPENPPPFRGVFATAYVLADRPIKDVCFERVLDIAEEHTLAFAWYDSADVRISGPFSGTSRTVKLAISDSTPNCFTGDTAFRAERGAEYSLQARFVWDSAGRRAVSNVTGTARVPKEFSIHRTAAAPNFAKVGGIPSNVFSLEFAQKLPPKVRDSLLSVFGDSIVTLQVRGDTAGFNDYVKRRGRAIQALMIELLSSEYFTYTEDSTLFYLNGALNTLSHYFSADRTPDVQAVLVSQRFERGSMRPETRFDSPLGIKPDSGEYYFPGEIRRLLIYPEAKGPKGWSLLDSIGIVNTWFHTGLNRLYFYGFEQAYYQYHATATQVQGGGGPADGDPRIKVKYNVSGGQGFFVGGGVDSFDVHIKVDSLTKAYSLPAARASKCRKEGWLDSKDCREYYAPYCEEQEWRGNDCIPQAFRMCIAPDTADTAQTKVCGVIGTDPRFQALEQARLGEMLYCVENAFPSIAECDAPKAACLGANGRNDCKDLLWDYCLDHQWKPAQCGAGLASYCHDKPRLSETLCRHADAWCAANADSPLCK